jgi:hypothetical protein
MINLLNNLITSEIDLKFIHFDDSEKSPFMTHCKQIVTVKPEFSDSRTLQQNMQERIANS